MSISPPSSSSSSSSIGASSSLSSSLCRFVPCGLAISSGSLIGAFRFAASPLTLAGSPGGGGRPLAGGGGNAAGGAAPGGGAKLLVGCAVGLDCSDVAVGGLNVPVSLAMVLDRFLE
jgi:hypothetical protein